MKAGYIIKHVTGTLVFFLFLFVSAGRINYWQGLIYAGIGLFMVALHYTILQPDAALLAERAKPGAGTKSWDKAILGISFLATMAMYITAGLDSGRFHWSPVFPVVFVMTGIILTAAGQLLFLIAQKQNKFFSSTVRIQTEREHAVQDTGLYSMVRHPAYLGSIIQAAGFPLLFGSLWSILPVSFLIILFFVRTGLEDKTLLKELPGYPGYAEKTRYRLIPWVW